MACELCFKLHLRPLEATRTAHSECRRGRVLEWPFCAALERLALMPKVGFLSLGCPKNLVDSEVMMGILAQHGFEITARADEADVLVVNTCSFIAPAQQESVDTILEMAEHKTHGRATRLVVTGCLVERYREQIMEQIPAVDAVIGTGEIERIVEAVTGG